MKQRSVSTFVIIFASLMLGGSSAWALAFSVDCLGGDTATCATGESQFSVAVSGHEAGTLVTFQNSGGDPAFITEVYFDDDQNLLGDASVNVGNVGFVSYADIDVKPDHLPGGNEIGWDYMAEPHSPGSNKDGVDGGETLGILFAGDVDEIEAALASGSLSIGLRGQGLYPDDESESFVATAAVPEPGAALLFGLGSAVVASRTRRRG